MTQGLRNSMVQSTRLLTVKWVCLVRNVLRIESVRRV